MACKFLLITGCQRTMNNTVYQRLIERSAKRPGNSWNVYKHPEGHNGSKFPTFNNLSHIAFENAIAPMLIGHYGIIDCVDTHFQSLCDLQMERAKLKDFKDVSYNVQTKTIEVPIKQSQDYMISDWSLPIEHNYLAAKYNVITARLFKNIIYEAEDALNNWNTEYLLVPNSINESEFHEAVKRFPFYKNYVLCDEL